MSHPTTLEPEAPPRLTPAVQTIIAINLAMIVLQVSDLLSYTNAAAWLGFDSNALPGRVKGDLHTPSLQIDKGVIFEGRSFMEAATQQPRAATQPPPKPAPVK